VSCWFHVTVCSLLLYIRGHFGDRRTRYRTGLLKSLAIVLRDDLYDISVLVLSLVWRPYHIMPRHMRCSHWLIWQIGSTSRPDKNFVGRNDGQQIGINYCSIFYVAVQASKHIYLSTIFCRTDSGRYKNVGVQIGQCEQRIKRNSGPDRLHCVLSAHLSDDGDDHSWQ